MASLGICQDVSELYWCCEKNNHKRGWELAFSYNKDSDIVLFIIAPILHRMMDELPEGIRITPCGGYWLIHKMLEFDGEKCLAIDRHLPNAIAKALIALKEK